MIVAAIIMAVTFALSSVVMARGFGGGPLGGPMGGHPGPGLMGLKTVLELNLTDTQKEQVLTIIEKYRDTQDKTMESLRAARADLGSAIHAEEFDEQKVRTAHRALSALMEELLVVKGTMGAEMKAVLSADQIELLKERRAQGMERMKKRRSYRRSVIENGEGDSLK